MSISYVNKFYFSFESFQIPPSNIEVMEKLIVVTGYGVFQGHLEKNASWECVKLLPGELEISGIKYKVIKKEIQVVYEDVNKEVDEIWKMNPSLVIHCGKI